MDRLGVYSSLRLADEPLAPTDEEKQVECVTGAASVSQPRASVVLKRETTPTNDRMLGVLSAMPSFNRKANGETQDKVNLS